MYILKQFYQKLIHHKQSSLIRILSLVPGLVCSLLIFSWVIYQTNFDRFHSKIDRIALVRVCLDNVSGHQRYPGCAPAMGPALQQDFPEIETFARINWGKSEMSAAEQKIMTTFTFADPQIFQILDFHITEGEVFQPNEPDKCLISERQAKALFGNKSPIGETVSIAGCNLTVNGIFKEDWPHNSSFQFSAVIPLLQLGEEQLAQWQNGYFFTTFLLLDQASNFQHFKEKVKDFYQERSENNSYLEAYLLKDLHLKIEGNQSRVRLLSFLALFLLLVACINFINLSTANFTTTTLETGIHKIMGATRIRLIIKQLIHVLCLVILSFLIALNLAVICLPIFCSLIGQTLQVEDYYNWPTLWLCISIIGFTTLFSGIYPAIFLSSFKPLNALKNKTGENPKNGIYRNILVSVQFIISIVLIISILTVTKQLNMYNDINLGYERQEVIYVELKGESQSNALVLKQELLKEPSVVAASACHHLPMNISWHGHQWSWEGMPADLNVYFYFTHVDSDWPKVMDIKMQEGEFFDDNHPGIVINDEAKKVLGWSHCTNQYLSRHNMEKPTNFKIAGVMDKFLFNNFKAEQTPLVIFPLKENVYNLKPSYLLVRVKGNQLSQMYNIIKNKVKEINGSGEVGFLSQLTQKFLQEEQQMLKMVSLFSILAIVISCLGLFGMATYVIERKRKEIGIRRVNGAKISEIIWLLNRNFIRPILIAFLIACPLAYFILNQWLEQYVHRVSIGGGIFILSAFITVVLVAVTLSWKSHKAAIENPVHCLRDE